MSPGAGPRRKGLVLVAAGLIALGLVLRAEPGRADPPPRAVAPLAWRPPERIRTMKWPAEGAPRPGETDAGPVGAVPELELVDVEPGDRLRIGGQVLGVGLGSGEEDLPDTILWLNDDEVRPDDAVREIYIPGWTSARTLVVREAASRPPARVEIAERESAPLVWHRFDQALQEALEGGGLASLPSPPSASAAAIVRRLTAMAAVTPPGVEPQRLRAWLMTTWLAASYRVRPLMEPYFVKAALETQGGHPQANLPSMPEASAWASGRAGETMTVQAARGDVLRLALSASRTGRAKVLVREGSALARTLEWTPPSRLNHRGGWTRPAWYRLVLPSDAPRIELEVVEGEVAFAAVGYRHKTDVFDFRAQVRNRAAWIARSRSTPLTGPPDAVVQALIESAAAGSTGGPREASEPMAAAAAPGLRALVRETLAELAVDPVAAAHRGAAALDAIRPLPPEVSGPTARALLERLASSATPSNEWASAVTPAAADPEDAQSIAVHLSLLNPSRTEAAAEAEAYARSHLDLPDAALWARQAWEHDLAWRSLVPEPGADVRLVMSPVEPEDPRSSTCPTSGPRGQRWTRLGAGRLSIHVPPVDGTHAHVILRGGFDTGLDGALEHPEPESVVRIDDTPITVHSAAGLPSGVAVAPGDHVLEHDASSDVFVRIPREPFAPCGDLRELERWTKADGHASFTLAAPGPMTLAEVVVSEADLPSSGVRLRVAAGPSSFRAWVRAPATGQAAWPVDPGSGTVSVDSEQPVDVRAYARIRPTPPVVVPGTPREARPQRTVDEWLEAVRTATRRLRAAAAPADALQAHADRREALEALGYHRLAQLDLPELGRAPEGDDARDERGDALTLPAGAGSVRPLGFIARVPPLPVDGPPGMLSAARARFTAQDMPGCLVQITDPTTAGASALLLAVAAERMGLPNMAAAALERIGAATHSGPVYARAATLTADAATNPPDLGLTLRAFVLAEKAEELGEDASGALGRLAPSIRWESPGRIESGAGFRTVAYAGNVPDPALGIRVRKAWLDAPDEGLLLLERGRLEVRTDRAAPLTVVLEARCDRLVAPARACRVVPAVDGHSLAARIAWPESPRLTVRIPAGSHRLELTPEQGTDSIGWATVIDQTSGAPLPARAVSDWLEVDRDRPLAIPFSAPTVLRLEARGIGGGAQTLRVTGDADETTPDALDRSWVLPEGRDAQATGVGEGDPIPLSPSWEHRLPILATGSRHILVSTEGRVLVRFAAAWAAGPPPARAGANPEPPDAPLDTGGPLEEGPLASPVYDPDVMPLSVGTSSGYVNSNLAQQDSNETQYSKLALTQYGEQSVYAQRELVERLAWAGFTAFGRVRDGPSSYGFLPTFDLAPNDLWPGVFLGGEAAFQPTATGTAVGGNFTAETYGSIPVTGDLRFAPWVALSLDPVDRSISTMSGADSDIYTNYNDSHPRHATAALRLIYKPFLDTILKPQLMVRSNPTVDGLDRADWRIDIDSLPGSGWWPWLGFTWQCSYRPVTLERSSEFVRDEFSLRVTFWRWIARGQRVSLGGALNAMFDVPQGSYTQPPFSGSVTLSYDWTGTRGLQDFPQRLVPLRDREEEGSGRIHRREPAIDPDWVTP